MGLLRCTNTFIIIIIIIITNATSRQRNTLEEPPVETCPWLLHRNLVSSEQTALINSAHFDQLRLSEYNYGLFCRGRNKLVYAPLLVIDLLSFLPDCPEAGTTEKLLTLNGQLFLKVIIAEH